MEDIYMSWIINAKKGNKNSFILFLCFEDKSKVENIANEIEDTNNVLFLPLKKLTKEVVNNHHNLIVYYIKEFSLGALQVFSSNQNIKILFLKMISQKNYQIQQKEIVMPSHPYILQVRDPSDIIKSSDIKSFLQKFISNFITTTNAIYPVPKKSIQLFLYRNLPSITNETIINDIDFLQYRSILTSRLAIFIYKICTFHYTASEKEIGLYFAKYYGRSKVVNGKAFGVINVKGYIIKNLHLQEQQIKLDIAKKLLYLKVPQEIIQQATGISFG